MKEFLMTRSYKAFATETRGIETSGHLAEGRGFKGRSSLGLIVIPELHMVSVLGIV